MNLSAKITLDKEQVIGEVHDHLYGANLEHLGQSIYGGIWAEMLRDRKFAGCDHMYTSTSEGLHNVHPNIGVVVPWEAVNPDYENVLCMHDNTTFYTGQQSQRITIRKADGQPHGIQQRGLYLQAEQEYEIRLVLKGEGQQVTVILGDVKWVIDSTTDDWITYTQTLAVSSDAPNGQFSITTTAKGSLWVGCASVMPASHIKDYRADLIDAMKDWTPTFLRWPGGNFVSAYHWEDGVGDRDGRPTYLDPAWHQWEPNDMGTDEFIDLCHLIGSKPVLTINMGNGTVEEAAAWVEYCNGDESTKYGALRVQNGYPEKHNVKVWFVGNEQFGNWQVGHVDAETYARRYLDYARAMRAVDPDLILIAVGVPTNLYGHWNELVLKIAAEEMDQFSVHYYSIRTEKWENPPSAELLYLPKIAASYEVAMMLDETLTIMDQHTDKPLPIAFDEWNTYYGAKSPDFIEDYNLADALYTGALMNACIQRCDRIKLSAIYHLVNVMGSYLVSPLYEWEAVNLGRGGGWIPISLAENPHPPATIKMPATLVMELMTKYRGKQAIQCEVDTPVFASPSAGNLPAYDDLPVIDASATYDAINNRIYLSLVNRHVKSSVDVVIDGISSNSSFEVYMVSGNSPLDTNTFNKPDYVSITSQSVSDSQLTIPPHTYMMITILLIE